MSSRTKISRLIKTSNIPKIEHKVDSIKEAIKKLGQQEKKRKKKVSRQAKLEIELLKNEIVEYAKSKGYEVYTEVPLKKFLPTKRQFRCDYLLEKDGQKIVIEINGGQYSQGRHNNSFENKSASAINGRKTTNYENDLDKINLIQTNGIKVFQYTYGMLRRKIYETNF
jgi:hypothetical protein